MNDWAGLFSAPAEAAPVWRHFGELCRIPRPSKGEAALRAHLQAWADRMGLAHETDTAGNLILRKPATPGQEHRPGLILQAHLDMVCQQNAGTGHDFTRDPIRPILKEIEGERWLQAEHTTLGADNGIGVALALSTLEDQTLPHPALEVLLTVDEEQGMGGAQGLEGHRLHGRRLINLDTEDWGEFYLGCAGGIDVNITHQLPYQPCPPSSSAWSLKVSGLIGGHSGVDIHLERGNAIKLLWRVLSALNETAGISLFSVHGGTARNALPREAEACFVAPVGNASLLRHTVETWNDLLREELSETDAGVCLSLTPLETTPATVLDSGAQPALVHAFNACPHGVFRMSCSVPGVVETSNNLGMIELIEGRLSANCMVRSFRASGYAQLAENITGLFQLIGAKTSLEGAYPGWTPNPTSPLLADCCRIFEQTTGRKAGTQVIHAGLECGILGDRIPGLDMVSFGPDIRGAHAPGERVRVDSVTQCWAFLKSVLASA